MVKGITRALATADSSDQVFSTLERAVSYVNSKDERSMAETLRTCTVEACYHLRTFGYKPHGKARIMGYDVEFISYPFPDPTDGICIMVREMGKHYTICKFVLGEHILKAAGL